MSFDSNDPRITAYALGDLGPDESKTFEAELGTNAALREEVQRVRDLSISLTSALAQEIQPRLSPAQRKEIAQKLTVKRPLSLAFLNWTVRAGAFVTLAFLFMMAVSGRHFPEVVTAVFGGVNKKIQRLMNASLE